MIFTGSCHTKVFETWVEKVLIKELKAGQGVILGNATFISLKELRIFKFIGPLLKLLHPSKI